MLQRYAFFRIFVPKLILIMKIIKWGFIGCGEVTEKKSGPAFNEIEGSKIEAVMSRSEQKARSYAERHGISNTIPMRKNSLTILT